MREPEDEGLPPLRGNQPAVAGADDDRIVVDAGAGTGKTTTMVARIQRLLSERDVDPGRILVLTFANKAAHGAVDRLTDALDGSDAYDIDAYTYHSFCYHILREYAYAAGLSPEFELLTDDRQRAVIGAIHEELTFRFVDPREADASDLSEYIRTFRRAGIPPDRIEETLPPAGTIAELASLVRELKSAADRAFGPDSRPDLVFGSGGNRSELQDAIEGLRRVVAFQARSLTDEDGADSDDRTDLERHVGAYLQDLVTVLERLHTQVGRSGGQWARVPSGLFGTWTGVHYRPLEGVRQTPIDRLEALIELFGRAHTFLEGYRQYEQVLRDRGALDYHGLVRRTIELLDAEPGIEVADRYEYVFCDEFQDTDSTQLELIELLTEASSLFVIGDADQAIYEWRGAEPTNITDIESSFPGIEAMALDLNFRSVQPILDLSNRLPGSNKTLRSNRGDGEDAVLSVSAASDPETQAQQVSATVSALLTGGLDGIDRHDIGDIAVLVRSNWHAERIAAAFEDDSIPYDRSGESRTDLPPGIRTLLSYFRVLVDPGSDRHLARVLQLVYRVPRRDVNRLADDDRSLLEAVYAVGSDDRSGDRSDDRADDRSDIRLDEPDRVERAAADIKALSKTRRTGSVSDVYETLQSRTRIEWTYTERDRTLLPTIEARIEAFDDAPMDTRLTPSLLSYLEDERGLTAARTGPGESGGSRSDTAVDVMTVHQAKGLDFGVVLVPFLGSNAWWPKPSLQTWGGRSNWELLRRLVDGEIDAPLTGTHSEGEAAEQWRVLHVALTRAKDRLVLFGSDDEPDGIDIDTIDGLLPSSIEWSHRGPVIDSWGRIQSAIEDLTAGDHSGFRDVTEAVESARTTTRQQITWYDGRSVHPKRAIEEVRSLARSLKRGELDPTPVGESRYRTVPQMNSEADRLTRTHSHTSIETYVACERKQYLDHVVDAFDDPEAIASAETPEAPDGSRGVVTAERTRDSEPSSRDVGNLFHYVAEDTFWRGYETRSEWYESCDRIAREREHEAAVPETKRCIDRYFETDIAGYDRIAVELPFSLDSLADRLEVDAIVGYIDAIYRRPDGEYVVVDYKTVGQRRTIEESQQLLLYLLGADRRFDVTIETAGYLYVGEIGPEFQPFDRETLLSRVDELRTNIQGANRSSFDSYSSGSHCQFCTHRSIGCAPDRYG